jgi:hypothetical protein
MTCSWNLSEKYSDRGKETLWFGETHRDYQNNEIRSVTVVRMEVPCCGGIEAAAKTALQNSGKFIPWNVVTIATDGTILDRVSGRKHE